MKLLLPTNRRLPHPLALLISLAAGVAQAVSIAAPWSGEPVWWLQIVSLAALLVLLERSEKLLHAIVLAWIFATSWLSATFWWLFVSMHIYAGLPAFLALLAVLSLAGTLALYYTFVCALFWTLAPSGHALRAIYFAALWMLAELARGCWFTGFPWGAGGYAQLDGPLIGYAPWIGVYGLCFVIAWLACGLVQLRNASFGFRIIFLLVLTVPGLISITHDGFSQPAGSISIDMLQGNIPQNEKFQEGSGVPQALSWYAQKVGETKAQLVIAPETAIPLLPSQLPPGYWDALTQRFSAGGQAAMVGLPLGSLSEGYTNSMVGFKPGQSETWQYDKHHLVPFGEFIPPWFKWFTAMMNIPLGDFSRGGLGQASFEWSGQRLAANICYEDLFGEELGARFLIPTSAPTIFVNSSNIAWFGNTLAIDQHLQISRLRAIEFERPFVRATNTGATAVIDHLGHVSAQLPRHTQGVLTAQVEGRQGFTPYAFWVSRWGLWPLWLFGISVILVVWRLKISRFKAP